MPKPSNCIPVADAKQLQANWMSTRAVDIERGMGSKDVCAVTFNIDQLQEFIDYVKDGSSSPNPGIRIYFAAYDDEKSDKATCFLCPTTSDAASADNDYSMEPLNLGSGLWPPRNY
ncbi:MAG: hypothetical protein AAFP76_11250 [Bacteroidota bacterium]